MMHLSETLPMLAALYVGGVLALLGFVGKLWEVASSEKARKYLPTIVAFLAGALLIYTKLFT